MIRWVARAMGPSNAAALASIAALLVGSALGGCAGAPSPHDRSRDESDPESDDGCPADQTRLGAECWSARGTRWRVQADGPGGTYDFEIELLAAGRVRSTDHTAATPASDEWFQDGPLLRLFLSDRFVEYRARVTNGTVLIGEAVNVRGQRWSWSASRLFGEAACLEAEARLEGACMTVAGTRWELALDGGAPRLVEFLDGGRVGTGASDTSGPWTQRGAALRFSLAEDGPTLVADVSDADELRGSVEGDASRGWTATRVRSIPPLIHR